MNYNLTEDEKTLAVTKEEESHYRSEIVPVLRKELLTFVKETKEAESDFVNISRLTYLEDEIKWLERETKEIFDLFEKNGFSFLGDVVLKVLDYSGKKNKLKRLKFEYSNIGFDNKFSQSLPEEEIAMAREADCSQFLSIKKRAGKKNWAICPFHNDTNPSLCCYEDGKGFYCFSCGVGGDAITLVKELHHLEFRDAVNFINNK